MHSRAVLVTNEIGFAAEQGYGLNLLKESGKQHSIVSRVGKLFRCVDIIKKNRVRLYNSRVVVLLN